MPQEIHLNDVGTIFELTVMDGDTIVDISLATELLILFKKPDGTVVEQTASKTTDGTDGKMQYVTIAGDLDALRVWKIQGRVTLQTGKWSTEVDKFTVYPNVD